MHILRDKPGVTETVECQGMSTPECGPPCVYRARLGKGEAWLSICITHNDRSVSLALGYTCQELVVATP